MSKRVIVLVLAGLAVVGGLFYSQYRPREVGVSGFVEIDEIRLGSRVGGRVIKVHVAEGDTVREGNVLVELDPFDLIQRRDEAAAQLAARQAEYEKLAAGFRTEEVAQAEARRDELKARYQEMVNGPRKETIAASRARVGQAQAEANYARANSYRIRLSYDKQVATDEELDKAINAAEAAAAVLAMRKEELRELEAGSRPEDVQIAKAQLQQAEQAYALLNAGSRKEDIASALAAKTAAEAALQVVESQLAELHVRAPADGVIESCDLQPGDLVPPNAPALTMLTAGKPYVRAFVPENRLEIQLGSKVQVSTDSLPGRRFAGHVTFVSRRSEFAPSNVQTTEKRAEEVFRVKIALDEGQGELRPGMPVDVWLGREGSR